MKSLLVLVTAAFLAGCGPGHIAPYFPKKRSYGSSEGGPSRTGPVSEGSLMRREQGNGSLFSDARAFRENDIVIVKVEESADAQRKADTGLGKSSSFATALASLPFFGRIVRTNPAVNLEDEARMGGSHDMTFKGEGSTGRSEHFVATVPVVVRQVLSNGNLFVEGHRVILVNNEEHHFYVSGVIRPIDIDQENSIKSSQVADAEIEFVGRGSVTDAQDEGWFTKFANFLSPF